MTSIRTMAPMLVGVAPVAGTADRDPVKYREFWAQLDASAAKLHHVRGVDQIICEHAVERDLVSQYRSIEADSLPRSPHIMTITLARAENWPALPKHVRRVGEAVLRVYQHGIGLFEVSFELEDPPAAKDLTQAWLDGLERDTIAFTEKLAHIVSDGVMEQLRQEIRAADPRERMVHATAPDPAEPLVRWVSRSLIVCERDRALLGEWTKNTIDDETAHLRDELLAGNRDSLVRWLNYGFVDADDEGPETLCTGAHSAQYSGLRFAQETYAALDTIDSTLQRVLSKASAVERKWQLEELRGDLILLSQRAELIIMERQQLLKYMTRGVRAHFEGILQAWEHDRLVEEPVLFKIELCQRRLSELGAKRAARSSLVTDLILLGIGITSIAGTALAISEFGRTSATDPASTGFDLGASRFTSWFSAQPIDVVLLASAAASSVIVALYLFFRSDDGSN